MPSGTLPTTDLDSPRSEASTASVQGSQHDLNIPAIGLEPETTCPDESIPAQDDLSSDVADTNLEPMGTKEAEPGQLKRSDDIASELKTTTKDEDSSNKVNSVVEPQGATEIVDDQILGSSSRDSTSTLPKSGSPAICQQEVVKDRIYTLQEFVRLNKNPFEKIMIPMESKTVTMDRDPMMRLVMVLCRAFKHPGLVDLFLEAVPPPDEVGLAVLSSLKPIGLQVIDDCLRPYANVSKATDMPNERTAKLVQEPRFSTLKINPVLQPLNLVGPTERPPRIDSANVSDYMSDVEGLRVSIIFLSLFVNMGAYVPTTSDTHTPPCFFSQPSVNSRHLIRTDVNKYGTDLYSKKCIYEYTEEVVIIPYCVSELLDKPSESQIDKIMSVALGESTGLVSEKAYVARWINDYEELDYLFKFFMGESIDTMLPTWLPENLQRRSADAYNLCFCIFLEQLFKKFNGLSTRKDWVGLYKHMEKNLELEEAFRYQDSRSIQWIWHRCHVMMCALTSLRVATGEGNHRMQSVFVAMFNLRLHQSVNDLEKKALLIQSTELESENNTLQVSRICKAATVTMSWPRVQKESAKQEIFLPYEVNMLKHYSALQQNKKDGSVSRAMINVVSSYLSQVRDISSDDAKWESDFSDVHIPGSKQYMLWNLEAVCGSETLGMHKEAPNQELKMDGKEKQGQPSKPKKSNAKKETAQAAKASNKYQNDDNSTGLDARAMVAFREHFLENILKDDCKEIVEIRNSLLDVWSIDDTDITSSGFDPKNENRPRKLSRAMTTAAVLAKHIGYSWTIDRSIQGCLSVANLNLSVLRPKSLWPIVFLVSNFVHDENSLELMLQILQNNGQPQNASTPIDVTGIQDYPSLFDASTKHYGTMIIYCFLKPQMMLYDAYLALFKARYKDIGEVNIRNRYMFAIGKSWMRVVNRFGIWIDQGDIGNIHSDLRLLLSVHDESFSHSPKGRLGTNLPQLAAYVCYLISSGIFEWTSHSNMGSWTARTGAFDTPNSPPPSDWEIFVPEFKFGNLVCQVHPELVDIPALKIEDIVDFIILGSCKMGNEKTDKLTKNFKLWMNYTKTFNLDFCQKYIETNKRPVVEKVVIAGSAFGEGNDTPKRPATAFRQKLFHPQEYKKHLANGDHDNIHGKIKNNTTSIDDVNEYKVRLDEMSTALLEAALFLRYQKWLLTFHFNEKTMPNGWNPPDVMSVLQKRGGEESRPFYHPAFTRALMEQHIEVEMKNFAHLVYKDIREKEKATNMKTAKAAILEASEYGFKVSDAQYDSFTAVLEEKKERNREKQEAARKEEVASAAKTGTFPI